MSDRPLPKREVFMEFIQSESVFVHFDPRPIDVVVPLPFKARASLVLQVGLNMPVPIPDLRADDWGLTATLSFSRQPFTCKIPWTALYAMVTEPDRRGHLWPNDVPDEIAASMGVKKSPPPPPAPAVAAEPPPAEPAAKPKKRRSKKKAELPTNVVSLKDHTPPPPPTAPAVAGAEPLTPPQQKKRTAPPRGKAKRELPSYLRVVK